MNIQKMADYSMERRTFLGSVAALFVPYREPEPWTTSGGEGPNSTPSTSSSCSSVTDYSTTPSEGEPISTRSTVNGLECAPIVFDDRVINVPILPGEIYL